MSKRTPGAWEVTERVTGKNGNGRQYVVTVIDPRLLPGEKVRKRAVALIYSEWPKERELANARIMAAAPRLQEALEALVDVVHDPTPEEAKALGEAMAALAAAEDES